MDFKIKEYNQYQLKVGAKYSICPICSKNRTKKHQKCMMLDWETAIGTCQHCGEVIQLHSYMRDNGNNEFYKYEKQTNITRTLTNNITDVTKSLTKSITNNTKKQTKRIKFEILNKSRNDINNNKLFLFLVRVFGHIKAKELSDLYLLGSAKHWKGASVFWQVDTQMKVRTGKIMLYDPISGKRIKQPYNHIAWVHKVIKIDSFQLEQCFYGEHLINNYKQIAIVESEKTAIIASAYIPQFTWLAVGSLNNLSVSKCKVLEGKTITLYPDLNAYDKWTDKARQIEQDLNIKFIISDLLETKASKKDKEEGLDLADYLIKHNWKDEKMTIKMKILDDFVNINPSLLNLIEGLDMELQ